MYISNRRFDFGVDPKFNGAGLWIPDDDHWMAETALRWSKTLHQEPIGIRVAPFGLIQDSFSTLAPAYGAGLPPRSIRISEYHARIMPPDALEALIAHEGAHIFLRHETGYFIRMTRHRNHIHEYQADALGAWLTSHTNLIDALQNTISFSMQTEDTHWKPTVDKRISRLSNLGDLSHIPPERIIPWIERNIR